jgi:hypothetical protein
MPILYHWCPGIPVDAQWECMQPHVDRPEPDLRSPLIILSHPRLWITTQMAKRHWSEESFLSLTIYKQIYT